MDRSYIILSNLDVVKAKMLKANDFFLSLFNDLTFSVSTFKFQSNPRLEL